MVPAMPPVSGAPILVLGHGASGSAATMAPHVAGLRARAIDARTIDLPKGRAERAVPRYPRRRPAEWDARTAHWPRRTCPGILLPGSSGRFGRPRRGPRVPLV